MCVGEPYNTNDHYYKGMFFLCILDNSYKLGDTVSEIINLQTSKKIPFNRVYTLNIKCTYDFDKANITGKFKNIATEW